MKKIFFPAVFLLLIYGSAFAAANNTGASHQVSFKGEMMFASAFDGNTANGHSKAAVTARFKQIEVTQASANTFAGTNEEKGENQLPVSAKRTFAKMFEGYEIKQAVRVTTGEGEAFYISAENEKDAMIVKVDEALDISVFKKSRK